MSTLNGSSGDRRRRQSAGARSRFAIPSAQGGANVAGDVPVLAPGPKPSAENRAIPRRQRGLSRLPDGVDCSIALPDTVWNEVSNVTLSVLSLISLPQAIQEEIRAVDPSVALTMAPGWFDGEIRETWPAFTTERYLRAGASGQGTRAERDALLAEAEVVVIGFPFPLDIRARAPKLKWVHQRPAGASNLRRGDLWDAGVVVTSSRGRAHNLPIAEYVLAGILHFAKGLQVAETERAERRFRASAYEPMQLAGKTVCVVGAGGIGREVGRLCAAAGMRVVGTRRNPAPPGDGFSEVRGAGGLLDLLAESDFVAVCCQWTPETENLIGPEAFAAMKDGAVLHQHRPRRDRRREGAGRRARGGQAPRRRARRLRRRVRTRAGPAPLERPAGPAHPAHLGRRRRHQPPGRRPLRREPPPLPRRRAPRERDRLAARLLTPPLRVHFGPDRSVVRSDAQRHRQHAARSSRRWRQRTCDRLLPTPFVLHVKAATTCVASS